MKILDKKREVIQHCAENNTEDFNFAKIVEELAEFQEVMAKMRTKHPNNPEKPKKEELIKEFGDVIYRGIVYIKSQFPEYTIDELMGKLEERVDKKLSKLEEYRKLGRYATGL